MNINDLLKKMVEQKGSDLFLTVGIPPCMKLNGDIVNLDQNRLTPEETQSMVFSFMTESQKMDFIKTKECNFAIQTDSGRFRVNTFYQRCHVGAVLRHIETIIPALEQLNLPKTLEEIIMLQKGLIILVGATGSGKSSSLAAMLDFRNKNSYSHIITIEDPVEFIYSHEKSIITQREVGIDTESFDSALKNTLRQSPNVILIGEIRTQETMNYAINFAETGHLCLATLHANNANQTMDRIINFFPSEKHHQLLSDLSLNLKAVIAQQLIPLATGSGRVPAVEILINTPAISECIKKGDFSSIKELMGNNSNIGMQTFDQALFKLFKENKITYEEALKCADSENELRLMIKLSSGNILPDSNAIELKLEK